MARIIGGTIIGGKTLLLMFGMLAAAIGLGVLSSREIVSPVKAS